MLEEWQKERGAFFKLEGTLHPAPAWASAAFIVGNAPLVKQRVLGLGGAWAAGAMDGLSRLGAGLARAGATGLAFRLLAGMSRDRIEVLAKDYAQEVLLPGLRQEGLRLLAQSFEEGYAPVLIAETIEPICTELIKAIEKKLGISFCGLLCNRLEFDEDDHCTGNLSDPVQGPEVAPQHLRRWAEQKGIALEKSRAYGSQRGDLVLLALVGQPCALCPDAELRRVARELGWPIVDAPSGHKWAWVHAALGEPIGRKRFGEWRQP
ncbi:MAG: haloacid dehalogenase-like hydrolase [Sandaracinaceae bacterium]|nr:haloacid dehalogenase-like hydrolase [Sandaracinaceae bacterium]